MSLKKVKVALQYCVPQHLLSRLVGCLAASEWAIIKLPFIHLFAKAYNITLDDAQRGEFSQYKSFNDFFTRALKEGARPIDETTYVSPVDGEVSQTGKIEDGQVYQAKGHSYSLTDLLGGNSTLAETYQQGSFATIYLAPSDYHRIHMPCRGKLKRMVYVPGRLFSVNQLTTKHVSGLFARNERVVCYFDTEYGEMAMVLVGAMIVASIETVWAGNITPPRAKRPFTWHYKDEDAIVLDKGQEMGRFKLGSTVVMAFEKPPVFADKHQNGSKIRLGEALADLADTTAS
ncbi:archaetidylserine decarboxylase [Gayadomonas joobiniege]|uniref:archaetidylserine decarboxylase n=1 Tax=Gayadomonas joobiniege TaxID=1234606 RepID=UPI00037FD1C4|nr:archaetidylserine decarboxylase [Gayadomonas joobiniege]